MKRLVRENLGHFLAAVSLVFSATIASAQNTALVIGNTPYGAGCLGNLPGASIDADNMEKMLAQAGWSVVKLKDQTRAQMIAAITANIPTGTRSYLIFYAGHGRNTVAGQGALIGIDCLDVTPANFQAALGAAKDRTFVILDSCGSGGFALATQDANNRPAFMAATNNVNSCSTRTGIGGDFTNALRACANISGQQRTAQQVSACLSAAGGYDATNQPHYYNGSLPNTVLGNAAANGGFCFGTGAGASCPCGNNGAAGNGCRNASNPAGANLALNGTGSIAADTTLLVATGIPLRTSVLFVQGSNQLNSGMGIPLADGLRCAGGTVIRLGVKFTTIGTAQYGQPFDVPISIAGSVIVAQTRYYQAAYRDVQFCTPLRFNFTNGYRLTWTP